ncbi:MAG: glycosyl hydrolase family 95 catalytic domain-containing protein, partial [Planctomycetota bacterium]
MRNRPKPSMVSSLILVLAFIYLYCASSNIMAQSSILSVDYRNLVSRADLTYDKPVPRREEGLPVGNGTMGSLVWTSPSALKFQINRVDVYANNSYTNSFNRRDWD